MKTVTAKMELNTQRTITTTFRYYYCNNKNNDQPRNDDLGYLKKQPETSPNANPKQNKAFLPNPHKRPHQSQKLNSPLLFFPIGYTSNALRNSPTVMPIATWITLYPTSKAVLLIAVPSLALLTTVVPVVLLRI